MIYSPAALRSEAVSIVELSATKRRTPSSRTLHELPFFLGKHRTATRRVDVSSALTTIRRWVGIEGITQCSGLLAEQEPLGRGPEVVPRLWR